MYDFLAGILNGINSLVNNYGWTMIIFTVIIKLLIVPLDFKSRKSMRRMSSLQPQITKLQKRYANDKEKLNQKTAELYRKEKINPLSGCLPMLLSMPILIIMFGAMRHVANIELAKQTIDLLVTGTQNNEGWLWIKNLWMPDSPFAPIIADNNSLRMVPADVWQKVYSALDSGLIDGLAKCGIDAANISGDTIFAQLQLLPAYVTETALWSTMPTINMLLFKLNIYAKLNGWFLLPVLACFTQVLMTKTQPQTPTDTNAQGASSGKFMKYFFPVFSLYICSSSNAAFSLYWVISNVFAWIEGIIINNMLEKKEMTAKASIEEDGLK